VAGETLPDALTPLQPQQRIKAASVASKASVVFKFTE
jgi:hypothetical protein